MKTVHVTFDISRGDYLIEQVSKESDLKPGDYVRSTSIPDHNTIERKPLHLRRAALRKQRQQQYQEKFKFYIDERNRLLAERREQKTRIRQLRELIKTAKKARQLFKAEELKLELFRLSGIYDTNKPKLLRNPYKKHTDQRTEQFTKASDPELS